jgi:DNA-binding PadR family transcriptional regulator
VSSGTPDQQPRAAVTPAVFALLLALVDGDRHGYALMRDVEELTGGVVRMGPGTLYRSLQRMRVDGFVEELAADAPDDERADRRAERRRVYRLTAAGRRALEDEARRLARLVDAAEGKGVLVREMAGGRAGERARRWAADQPDLSGA